MESIFVGEKITMEGIYIEIPKEMSFFKKSIDDAIYNAFENVFTVSENRIFLKTMKMNGLLFDFMEYHIKNFFDLYKDEIGEIAKESANEKFVQKLAQDYFDKSISDYKNKLLSVGF